MRRFCKNIWLNGGGIWSNKSFFWCGRRATGLVVLLMRIQSMRIMWSRGRGCPLMMGKIPVVRLSGCQHFIGWQSGWMTIEILSCLSHPGWPLVLSRRKMTTVPVVTAWFKLLQFKLMLLLHGRRCCCCIVFRLHRFGLARIGRRWGRGFKHYCRVSSITDSIQLKGSQGMRRDGRMRAWPRFAGAAHLFT